MTVATPTRLHLPALLVGLGATIAVVLALASPAAAGPACDIVGTEGDDVLIGTDADEVICGLGGDDVIRGGRGHDVLVGGAGHDVLIGGPGHDLLLGGTGDDTLTGRTGRDRLVGQSGDDRLEGSNGRDRLLGGAGADHCTDRRGVTRARDCEIGEGGVSPAHFAARQRWDALEVDEFVYSLQERPACLDIDPACLVPEHLPVVVRVRGGGASAAADVVPVRTAGELFDEAHAAEATGGTVEFHETLGLPTSIATDVHTVTVTGIELRDGLRQRLEEAIAAWAHAGLADYAFGVREVCACPAPVDVRITVGDGEVIEVTAEDGTPAEPSGAQPVDWHLARIEALLDGHNGSVTASFDRRLGYPISYSVDRSGHIADDKRTVQLLDFDHPDALHIVDVGGIQVNATIAPAVEQLLAAALADGFTLGGGGYRDPSRQIELRMANCGTTEYAIWEMPASECNPPTARPGQSMHEQGLAIDFTHDGRLVTSRSEAAFVWLADNAPIFGFANHPVEPWHWSTNGN